MICYWNIIRVNYSISIYHVVQHENIAISLSVLQRFGSAFLTPYKFWMFREVWWYIIYVWYFYNKCKRPNHARCKIPNPYIEYTVIWRRKKSDYFWARVYTWGSRCCTVLWYVPSGPIVLFACNVSAVSILVPLSTINISTTLNFKCLIVDVAVVFCWF